MRILQLVRGDPIPTPALKKPARHQLLIPERIGTRSSASRCARATELNHRSARSRCRLRKSWSIVMTGWRGGGVELVAPGSLPHDGKVSADRR